MHNGEKMPNTVYTLTGSLKALFTEAGMHKKLGQMLFLNLKRNFLTEFNKKMFNNSEQSA